MKPIMIERFGLQFHLQQEVLFAYLLGQPQRARTGLRSVQAVARALPMTLLERLPAPPAGIPPQIRVVLDPDAQQLLNRMLEAIPLTVTLITGSPCRVELLRELLPPGDRNLQVSGFQPGMEGRVNILQILDALDGEGASGNEPDDSGMARLVVHNDQDHCRSDPSRIPIRMLDGVPRLGQRPGRVALRALLQSTRFGHLLDRFQATRRRWVTGLEATTTEDGMEIQVSFQGEQQCADPSGLHIDIPLGAIPNERFSDICGHAEAVRILRRAVDWLKEPGASSPPYLHGVLLAGPPGTGKSLLARAVAGEAQVPCFLAGGAEFVSMWYGESERKIRELLRAAGNSGAAVVIVDELDGVAHTRQDLTSNSAAHQSTLVAELLASLDRLRHGPGRVLFIATTNYLENIDPAVIRSARIGEHLHVGYPGLEDRCAILRSRFEDLLSPQEIDQIARLAEGLSQADLAMLDERIESRPEGEGSLMKTLQAVVLEQRFGASHQDPALSTDDRHRVAIHEAGHAVATRHLLGKHSLGYISVVPSAAGLGFVIQDAPVSLPMNANEVRKHMVICLAGRAAEIQVDPELGPTIGCESDLRRATELAESAVGRWGLDDAFPLVSMAGLSEGSRLVLAQGLVGRVQDWVGRADTEARELVAQLRPALDKLAQALLERGGLSSNEVDSLLDE